MDCVSCKPVCRCNMSGALCQDPRFVGEDGVTFYFHGYKDEDFCLLSNHNLHINSHFIGNETLISLVTTHGCNPLELYLMITNSLSGPREHRYGIIAKNISIYHSTIHCYPLMGKTGIIVLHIYLSTELARLTGLPLKFIIVSGLHLLWFQSVPMNKGFMVMI